MPKCKRPPIHQDPHVLTAVADFRRQGLADTEAMRRLHMSRRTYYKCRKAIEELRQDAGVDDE